MTGSYRLLRSYKPNIIGITKALKRTRGLINVYRGGIDLAYWGLVYAAFGLALLGIALLKSHGGCMFLIGDCYQPRLPSWLFNFKLLYNLKLLVVNSIAVTVIILNVRRSRKLVSDVAEIES